MDEKKTEKLKLKPLDAWFKGNIENRLAALRCLKGNDYLLAKGDLSDILKERFEAGYFIQNYSTDFRMITRRIEKSFEEGDLKYRGRDSSL